MPRRRVFNFHDDPGHGWLEVKFTTLRNHGWRPMSFTEYSYFDLGKGVVYLEKDIDAPTLLRWYDEQGYEWAMRENIWPSYAPIRNLPRLDPSWYGWPDTWLPHLDKEAAKAVWCDDKWGQDWEEAKRSVRKLRKQLHAERKKRGFKQVLERDKKLYHGPNTPEEEDP